jgi:alkaline phosphatase D
VQSGDVGADGGVVWARADRPSQMMVEVSTTESFAQVRALPPIAALPESDFTAKMLLENLPAGRTSSTASNSATSRTRRSQASR